MPDEFTRREIDKVASRTLKEAGMREPPFLIDNLLDHLEIDREFFDLDIFNLCEFEVLAEIPTSNQLLKSVNVK